MSIYVLELLNNKYYVGKTDSKKISAQLFANHVNGTVCEWTKKHRGFCIIENFESNNDLELDMITKKYMLKYGIENVRGGSYSDLELETWQVKALEHELNLTKKEPEVASNLFKDLYLSEFNTESELDAEIKRLTDVRKSLTYIKKEYECFKYITYEDYSGLDEWNMPKLVKIKKLLEPSIIDSMGFRDYKYSEVYCSKYLQPGDRMSIGQIYQNCIANKIPELDKHNVVENIYRIYVERIKLKQQLNSILTENTLTYENCVEEVSERILWLYEKYVTVF